MENQVFKNHKQIFGVRFSFLRMFSVINRLKCFENGLSVLNMNLIILLLLCLLKTQLVPGRFV